MPVLPPVMRAILPSSFPAMVFLPCRELRRIEVGARLRARYTRRAGERAGYNEARKDYHADLPMVNTPVRFAQLGECLGGNARVRDVTACWYSAKAPS